MTTRVVLYIIAILSMILTGCGGLNVSLLPETKPLVEQTLEGAGKPKILLIDLDGIISFKEEQAGLITRRPSKVAYFREAFRKAEEDSDIAGVIIKINSPGGTVSASDAIYHEIIRFRQKRNIPIYAYIMEVGASGGYYVACAADRIVASPTAITGSIGVVAMKLNIEGLLSKIGVSDETYKSGPKKDFWSPFRASTPDEKQMLQEIIDRLYARFVDVVHLNRQKFLTKRQIETLADGRIMTADAAAAAQLIDQVAYLDDTIESLKKTLNLENAEVITYSRPRTFKSNIYSEMPSTPQVINLISINSEELALFSGIQYMYLWTQ
jgi:protease IV